METSVTGLERTNDRLFFCSLPQIVWFKKKSLVIFVSSSQQRILLLATWINGDEKKASLSMMKNHVRISNTKSFPFLPTIAREMKWIFLIPATRHRVLVGNHGAFPLQTTTKKWRMKIPFVMEASGAGFSLSSSAYSCRRKPACFFLKMRQTLVSWDNQVPGSRCNANPTNTQKKTMIKNRNQQLFWIVVLIKAMVG